MVNSAENQTENVAKELSAEQKISLAINEQVLKQVVKPRKKRTLLVFSRTMSFRHQSIRTGKKALTLLGGKTKAFEAVISDDLRNFEKPRIDRFDAICFLNTTHEVFSGASVSESKLKKNLLEFIARGKGFVAIHAASDTFHKWRDYGEMLGAYFVNHPWRSNAEVVIDVEKGAETSPFNVGFKDCRLILKEEIYQFKAPYDSQKLNMLTRLNTDLSGMNVTGIQRKDSDFGISWYKTYGAENKGRVFYCSLGHNHHIYWHSTILSHYLAGIQYALGDLDSP